MPAISAILSFKFVYNDIHSFLYTPTVKYEEVLFEEITIITILYDLN